MRDDVANLSAGKLRSLGHAAWNGGDRPMWRACVRELERRRTRAAAIAGEELRSLVGNDEPRCSVVRFSEVPTRRWIGRIARMAEEFRPRSSGDYSVYATLLARDEAFGVYVGMTHLTVDERFRNQKNGVQAGRGYVRDYGVRVLHEVGGHLRGTLSFDEAQNIERGLHARLLASRVWAEGGH